MVDARAESGEASKPSRPLVPTLEVPKGGGALRGLDEKLTANPVTGTAGFTIPLPLPGGRGCAPELSLGYDSGAGNGPFGAGLTLSIPHVSRRTDKGVPRYADGDVFVLTGEDDLVPYLIEDGDRWRPDERVEGTFRVRRYRPRVDAKHARIEHWEHAEPASDHWRVVTGENVTHVFAARLADPDDPRRIFRWSLSESRDDRGDRVIYEYVAEDDHDVSAIEPGEQGRGRTNVYLSCVRWGNRTPAAADWMFALVFDYGDHPTTTLDRDPRWPARADAFSSYRAGFEVRTHRRCERVLLFHHIAALAAAPVLVHSISFVYDEDPAQARLVEIHRHGHDLDGSLPFPVMKLTWTTARIDTIARELGDDSVRNLPAGIAGTAWVDLAGEGLSGALYAAGGGLYYKRNLTRGELGGLQVLHDATVPALGGDVQFADPEQRGQAALVAWTGPLAGYRYRDGDRWEPMRMFESVPLRSDAANARFLDVDGDGLADLVVTEDDVLRVYPALGARGFDAGRAVPYPTDEGGRPAFVWSDRDETIFLADMTGDGLTDVVRIRNGAVCYWPNLGHGRFAARVTMGNAPVFDRDLHFDPRRLRLADIDGSGPTDLVYLGAGSGGVWMWRNLAGTRFADPVEVAGAPLVDAVSDVTVVDLEADGTGCLVWSAARTADGRAPIRYLRLTGGIKPGLLESIDNGLGAVTTIAYEPSTFAYVADERAGRPWATRLPFPVHVVTSIVRHEVFTNTRTVTTYAYHHGTYDPIEREFRGFGLVEQVDADVHDEAHRPIDADPRRAKTWFHTGVMAREGDLDAQFRREWTPGLPLLPAHEMPAGDPELARDAIRALKGRALREEVFGDDESEHSTLPYVATQHRLRVRMLQPRQDGHPACFAVEELESLAAHTERAIEDPRLAHTVNLAFDELGQVLESVAVAYPRAALREADEQGLAHAVLTVRDVRFAIADPTWHRVGVAIGSSTWELVGLGAPAGTLYTAGELVEASASRRLLGAERHLYQDDEATDLALPYGEFRKRALPFQSQQLAFVEEQLADLDELFGFDRAALVAALVGDGGYVEAPDPRGTGTGFWTTAGRAVLNSDAFFLPKAFIDAFGNETTASYDEPTGFLMRELVDELDNETTVLRFDYVHLQPVEIEDANDNVTEIAIDARGAVTAVAIKGKPDDAGGWEADTLDTATQTFEYRFAPLPASARTRSRTEHRGDRFEESVTHFDGLGRALVVKHSAEPGVARAIVDDEVVEVDAPVRWIASGRVVRDNKGEPVRQYEPYFAATDAWENDERLDAGRPSSTLVRDPLGRVIETRHEDGSYAAVHFSPWHEERWDENDTIGDSSWVPPSLGDAQLEAHRAKVVEALRASPATTRLDSLGRPVVAIAIVDRAAGVTARTHTELDVAGNALKVTSPVGLAVRTQRYDLQKRAYWEEGVDDGRKLAIVACDGKPLRALTARGYRVDAVHDELRRIETLTVTPSGGAPFVAEQHVYGEASADAVAMNRRGRPWVVRDAAGEVETIAYDHAGRPRFVARRFTDPDVEVVTATVFDALGRTTEVSSDADPRVQRHEYGLDGKLSRVSLDGVPVVKSLVHEANGQRRSITYGNDVVTEYDYDDNTLRLTSIRTRRANGFVLQDWHYAYDAAGNITSIDDPRPSERSFHDGEELRPRSRYEYDGLHRLVAATGREHIDQTSLQDQLNVPEHHAPTGNPRDWQRLRMYTERYEYDLAGNIRAMSHAAKGAVVWKRRYLYEYERWTETADHPRSNRLYSTSLEGDLDGAELPRRYTYDAHGNTTAMPGIPDMRWDWREAMVSSATGDATTRYVCDAAGQRVRKTWDSGGTHTDRYYLGACELYREGTLERRSVHVMDDRRRVLLSELDSDGTLHRYQLDDHLGTSRLELGGPLPTDDTELSREDTHPYGTVAYQAWDSTLTKRPKRFRFTGMERDTETGLSLHGVRYYAPYLARWTSPDPIGIRGGSNLYEYCRSTPMSFRDPAGLDVETIEETSSRVSGKLVSARTPDPPAAQAFPFVRGQKFTFDNELSMHRFLRETGHAPPPQVAFDIDNPEQTERIPVCLVHSVTFGDDGHVAGFSVRLPTDDASVSPAGAILEWREIPEAKSSIAPWDLLGSGAGKLAAKGARWSFAAASRNLTRLSPRAAEKLLPKLFPGAPAAKSLATTFGIRVFDHATRRGSQVIYLEVKVGAQSLSSHILQQLAKEDALVAAKAINPKNVIWSFFGNEKAESKISQKLIDALLSRGYTVMVDGLKL